MGSSRASTSAGRRRTSQRAGQRSRTTPHSAKTKTKTEAKPKPKPRPAAHKPKPKPKAKPRAQSKSRAKPRARAGTGARRAGSSSLPKRMVEPINLLTIAVVLLCLVGTYYFWFRDSQFVAVERVAVEGVDGPGSEEITAALTEAAGGMTTLHVRQDELDAAVAGFPTVIGVEAEADFPKGLTITVNDRPPTMLAKRGDRALPIAADGTVLAGVDVNGAGLPEAEVSALPERGLLAGEDLQLALVVGAVPEPLRELISDVEVGDPEGVQVRLDGDVPIYFGSGERAADKWAAATALLASPKLDTLTYIDVRVPERPAVGGAAPPTLE